MVKHVVKEPFLTRYGIAAATCPEGLFWRLGLGYCNSGEGEMQVVSALRE